VQYLTSTLLISAVLIPKAFKPISSSSGDCPRHLVTDDTAPLLPFKFCYTAKKNPEELLYDGKDCQSPINT